MILRPLVKIEVRGMILTIGDKEFPIEIRSEYVSDNHEQPDRQRCFGPDGLQTDDLIDMLGLLTGLEHPSILLSCGPEPNIPPGYLITDTYHYTLHGCDYYFRDEVQEKQERENPDSRQWTKLPLEYLINLSDLTKKQADMLFRSINRQLQGGKMGGFDDPPPPPEPTPEEMTNIDELPPAELETLIGKLDAQQQWDQLKQTARKKADWFAKLKHANQTPRCAHIKPDGSPCGSPAVKDKTLCYWHDQTQLHRVPADGPLLDGADGKPLPAVAGSAGLMAPAGSNGLGPVVSTAFAMPVLEDHLGVQLGIMRVCDLLAAKSIDPYTAQVMLYGLRLAQRTFADHNSLQQPQ